jgi:hypothetical protein
MTLNTLRDKVKKFEKKAGFDKTNVNKLLEMAAAEIRILKANLKNKKIMNHKLMDLQVLLLQIANRYKTNLDSEWVKHFKKSEKYLKVSKS